MTHSDIFETEMPSWFPPVGDDGYTLLGGHGRVPKDDARTVAYGNCGEANAVLGLAVAFGQLPVEVNALLASIQNDLLDMSADLFVPLDSDEPAEARISEEYLHRLDRAVLHYAREVENAETRVLPGGTAASGLLYFSRQVVKRAERAVWAAARAYPEAINIEAARYLNHLSTLLVLLARCSNWEHGNIEWAPGASAQAMGPQDDPEADGEPSED